ncbi:AAA family ATPase [Bacillus wiedmannii]
MISSFALENFKLFDNHEIDFKPLTILAGANGAGKSSVIQAVLLMMRAGQVQKIGRNEVELNGPYLLQLGNIKNVISAQASSNFIKIIIKNSDSKEAKVNFEMDLDRAPASLQIIEADTDLDYLLSTSFRYLNAERIGPRIALKMNTTMDLDIGFQGEFTNYSIHQADILKREVHKNLQVAGSKLVFSKLVEAWLQTIIPDIEINLTPNYDVNMMVIKYKNSFNIDSYVPTATGFGITYVLPIIVAGLLSSMEKNAVLVIENPEAHLHPYSQSCIGKFLALLSHSGVQVILETHSEHVINGARLQLAKLEEAENMIINFFENTASGSNIKPITINSLGELSSWPVGFFDQQQQDLRDLLELRRK